MANMQLKEAFQAKVKGIVFQIFYAADPHFCQPMLKINKIKLYGVVKKKRQVEYLSAPIHFEKYWDAVVECSKNCI